MQFLLKNKWRQILLIFIFVLSVYFFTWSKSFMGYEPDTVDAAIGLTHGKYIIKKPGIGASLFYIPFIYAQKILLSPDNTNKFLTIVPIFYSALIAVFIFLILDYLKIIRSVTLITTACIALGSMLWPYSRIGMEFQTTFLVCALLAALLAWEQGRASPLIAGVVLALLTITKSYGIVFALPTLLFAGISLHQKRQLKTLFHPAFFIRLFGPTALAVVSLLCINFNLTGKISGAYKVNKEFQITQWWDGFWGTFFSPGKSIFLYNPLLLASLPLWPTFVKKYKASSVFILCGGLLLLLITAPFTFWSDESVSVRKLMPIIPLLHVPFALTIQHLRDKKRKYILGLVAVLSVAACYIQFINTIYPYFRHLTFWRTVNLDSLQQIRYNPMASQVYLNNLFFTSFVRHRLLGLNSGTYTYAEETWMRCCFPPRGKDEVIKSASINLEKFETPSIYFFLGSNSKLALISLFGNVLIIVVSGSLVIATAVRARSTE